MASVKASTPSGGKKAGAAKGSTSAKSTSSPRSASKRSGSGSGSVPLTPEMACIILQNALDKVQTTIGPVKLRVAAYDPGHPEFLVVLPSGVMFCETCGNLFPGQDRYCDAHKPPVTATPVL